MYMDTLKKSDFYVYGGIRGEKRDLNCHKGDAEGKQKKKKNNMGELSTG